MASRVLKPRIRLNHISLTAPGLPHLSFIFHFKFFRRFLGRFGPSMALRIAFSALQHTDNFSQPYLPRIAVTVRKLMIVKTISMFPESYFTHLSKILQSRSGKLSGPPPRIDERKKIADAQGDDPSLRSTPR